MTQRFNLSDYFKGNEDVIGEAVRKSNLPEGVNVVGQFEIDTASQPFVVLATATDWEFAKKALKAGALDYVSLDLDVERLAKKLSSKEKE